MQAQTKLRGMLKTFREPIKVSLEITVDAPTPLLPEVKLFVLKALKTALFKLRDLIENEASWFDEVIEAYVTDS